MSDPAASPPADLQPAPEAPGGAPGKALSPAAKRALEEAQARRDARDVQVAQAVHENGGPAGPDPVRFGDWERKGLAVDF